MKISIVSDTHFGYKWGEERGEDSFVNAVEALEKSREADLVILPGDIFDKKIPKQEVLDKAAEVLSIPMEGERNVTTDKELGMHGSGIPVVAIHGTHERRPSSYTNPIELMANTGHLHHLDNEKIVFEKDGEKVAVHGMSGVPEKYAPKVLEKFDPEPVEDAFNILVVHQSIENFVFTPEDEDYLTLEDFPEGFDLIVDGHIHWYDIDRFEETSSTGDKPLVFPGSTVTTQMRKIEAEKEKGFLWLDTQEEELEFRPLEKPRDVFYIEIEVNSEDWSEIKKRAKGKLEEIDCEKKPLVNLKIKGETSGRINPRELKQLFRDRMFLNVNSSVDTDIEVERERNEIESLEEGQEILEEKLDEDLGIDNEELFSLLAKGNATESAALLEEAVEKE